jgi:site-specific DNA-methyltransferase (adenine-specific)
MTGLPSPYYQDEQAVIYHADCRDVLPHLGPVDCVITDPPYGDTKLAWDHQVSGWASLLPASCLWCCGSMRYFLDCRDEFVGWKFAQEVVWEKHNGSGFTTDRFKRVHELVTHWYRGPWADVYKSPQYTHTGIPKNPRRSKFGAGKHLGFLGTRIYDGSDKRLVTSILRINSLQGKADHPTQKPLPLLAPLIQYSCPPGGVILDPFCGSGSTVVAAKQLGRKAIGIEISEEYCRITVDRLRQSILPFTPPPVVTPPHAALFAPTGAP